MKHAAALAVTCVLALLSTPIAAAVTYEPPIPYEPAPPKGSPPKSSPPGESTPRAPHFCAGGAIRNLSTPFKPRPRLPSPSPNGRIGFGPGGLVLKPLPRLLTGAGRVGYTLSLRPSAPVAHLDWAVTTTLSSVDRRGRFAERVKRVRRQVAKVSRTQDAGVKFRVEGAAAYYRVVSVFRDDSGRRLGRYGFYFRVLPSSKGAELVLDGSSYRAGDTVHGRVDNFGAEPVLYGTPYAIERPDGNAWVLASESPDGLWAMPLFNTQPGMAGRICSNFLIPPEMKPGRYRMAKGASLLSARRPADQFFLYAEFSVLP
jgi:hypothetical protein